MNENIFYFAYNDLKADTYTCMLILNEKLNCIELSDRCINITEYGICY